ncbi:MAG: hypothetical protein RL148_2787 [Planctomycetota bacterium]
MTPRPPFSCALLAAALAWGVPATLLAQDPPPAAGTGEPWNDDKLSEACRDFLGESPRRRLELVGRLVGEQQLARAAIANRIHGDHREYQLKVDRLLRELTDPRWTVREEAERSLAEIGGRAQALIAQRADEKSGATLEERIRCRRVMDALASRGTEIEERETRLLRGLVATAAYYEGRPELVQALRSAVGHTDAIVVEGALRALGVHGADESVESVSQMLAHKGGMYRAAALAALARMRSSAAVAECARLLGSGTLNRAEATAMVRALRGRPDAAPALAAAASATDAVVAAAATVQLPRATEPSAKAQLVLSDRSQLSATFLGFGGDATLLASPVPGLVRAEIPFSDCDVVDFVEHAVQPVRSARVFLNQGSMLVGTLLGVEADVVRVRSAVFGDLQLARKDVQGIAVDPQLDRLIGSSSESDRLRLRSGEWADGKVVRVDGGRATVAGSGGERQVALDEVAGILFQRSRSGEPDTVPHVRMDLTGGERLIGFLAASSASHQAMVVPTVGTAVVPTGGVAHVEFGVGSGAVLGFTLVADFSENRIVELDDQGREVHVVPNMYGAWDAECLENGNLLVTEYSVSRVQEIDRKGQQVWVFEQLRNPNDADRLPNGNTLICDTYGNRVIEVDREKNIVWKHDREVKPFDADRLANGNTLVADVLKDRVVEVNAAGEVVWELKNLANVHDADRLPNGNTLVTMRTRGIVQELDREGGVVWELKNLNQPSDADRLPNGNTLVAENKRVREFDRRGNVVWERAMSWPVEANRY